MPDRGRERPDTQQAMEAIRESRMGRPGPWKRLLDFQVFASILLVLVAIMTVTTFTYVYIAERDARERAVERSEFFETRVQEILTEIQHTQELGEARRQNSDLILERIGNEITELLREHRASTEHVDNPEGDS